MISALRSRQFPFSRPFIRALKKAAMLYTTVMPEVKLKPVPDVRRRFRGG